MFSLLLPLFAQASAAISSGAVEPSPQAPSEIVAAAPAADWVAIAPSDLLVMDLAPLNPGSRSGAGAKPRRVIIQLMPPPFSQGWVGNIRKLAAAHFWDGLSVNRVQDNYVAQWGDADGEDKAKARALPPGLASVPESEYSVDQVDIQLAISGEPRTAENEQRWRKRMGTKAKVFPPDPKLNPDVVNTITRSAPRGWHQRDAYAQFVQFFEGWALGAEGEASNAHFWPVHCYGMVGVGRNLSPDTGNGAELYTVIGHAPRHLDRNIALVGRVIAGIENLSSLPRGTEALGFYKTAEERTPIVSVRLGNEVAGLAAYQYLSTESAIFARYADARANRRDPFFNVPAGGADICNIPVPVRVAP